MIFRVAKVLVTGSKPINLPALTPLLVFSIESFCDITSKLRAILICLIELLCDRFCGSNLISKICYCVKSVDNETKL